MTVSPYAPYPPSLWANSLTALDLPPLQEHGLQTQVLVIGAGLSGLSTALHLARQGMQVTVLEAACVGWGASGRNNGQVIPTLTSAEPDAIEARFGEQGEYLVQLVRDSAAQLFELIRSEQIDCAAEQSGWFQPAHSAGRMALSEARVRAWEKRGAPVTLLQKAECDALLGSTAWHGGMLNHSGGHLNPLALAKGLALRCLRLGVRIYQRSPATAMRFSDDQWQVKTPYGQIRADNLVITTNAYSDFFDKPLHPPLARSIVPVRIWQLATAPLSEDIRASLLPGRQAVSDTHGDLRFFRYDQQHRLVSGGGLIFPFNSDARLQDLVGQRLQQAFPQLLPLRFDYVWDGHIAMTSDRMPHLHELGPRCWTWVGCNGRGVALSVALGKELAEQIVTPQQAPRLPCTRLRPIRFQRLGRQIAPAFLALYRWKDGREPAVASR
ncbi:FAD-dependent oxidoreductase [Pokkaliibacter plantistimulans]|uniref:FAD-dependent oxidoreductase n=1 Tax=Proteobacteria bacterium 228 TaxID=2083153 RepID=A0A2S5KK26_9PROT|nr:FAD-binding oxidoreductase [Pokkaliibacter plantistimulans]PPC75197.1 FAD-dependent oxidoreductase [Pokkaliibacter plantistimulans]